MKLPRCQSPEVDDYPPWLMQAVKDALGDIIDRPDFTDAGIILRAIDNALLKSSSRDTARNAHG